MEIRLDGRSAIVTGGSKGLGLAIAEEYFASGADVAILARDAGALAEARQKIQASGAQRGGKGKVTAISCDVSKADAIKQACDQVISEFGKVDIFVNNAGQSTRGPSETITDEMWQADLDLKLFAQIRVPQRGAPGHVNRRCLGLTARERLEELRYVRFHFTYDWRWCCGQRLRSPRGTVHRPVPLFRTDPSMRPRRTNRRVSQPTGRDRRERHRCRAAKGHTNRAWESCRSG